MVMNVCVPICTLILRIVVSAAGPSVLADNAEHLDGGEEPAPIGVVAHPKPNAVRGSKP